MYLKIMVSDIFYPVKKGIASIFYMSTPSLGPTWYNAIAINPNMEEVRNTKIILIDLALKIKKQLGFSFREVHQYEEGIVGRIHRRLYFELAISNGAVRVLVKQVEGTRGFARPHFSLLNKTKIPLSDPDYDTKVIQTISNLLEKT